MPKNVILKEKTLNKLDKIAELRLRGLFKKKNIKISELVKNKRGISYDVEINYLSDFYLEIYSLKDDKKFNVVLKEILKRVGKIDNVS